MRTVLLTGAAGFSGSHILRHLILNTTAEIICPVTFRHKGVPKRIEVALTDLPSGEMPWDRVKIVRCDLASPIDAMTARQLRYSDIDVIINAASESHVDRSIEAPRPFVENNVGVALSMLEFARDCPNLKVFLQVSTDEVYGPAAVGADSREWDPVIPSNPYSASKAAQEALCVSWWRTYGVPMVITNTMNLVGETQDAEKYIPMVVRKLINGQKIQIHAAPDGTIGSRFYLHCRNQADALLCIARWARDGALSSLNHEGGYLEGLRYDVHSNRPVRFNVVGEQELNNLEVAQIIRQVLVEEAELSVYDDDQDWYELVDFHSSRPGHDLRYALDGTRMEAFGWKPPVPLIDSLRKTVQWTLQHREWL